MYKTEREALTPYLNALRKQNPSRRVYKIPDEGISQKPFDVLVVKDGGIAMWFEFKYVRTKKMWYQSIYDALEPHQIINLQKIKNLWWEAIIWAYHPHTDQFYTYPFPHEQ